MGVLLDRMEAWRLATVVAQVAATGILAIAIGEAGALAGVFLVGICIGTEGDFVAFQTAR